MSFLSRPPLLTSNTPTPEEETHIVAGQGLGTLVEHLDPSDVHNLVSSTPEAISRFRKSIGRMPSTEALTALAKLGTGHREWYQKAKTSLESVFGKEAPRFIALLAATSSRKSVKANMQVAAQLW